MAWIYLFIAGLCEMGWSGIGLKLSGGGNNLKAVVITVVANNVALFFLMLASKSLPVSIAYPVFVGMGVAGSVTIGLFFFDEPKSLFKVLCITLIAIGIIGLKLMDKNT